MTNQVMGGREEIVNDEVELIDYLHVLCRRKILILLGTLLCVIMGGVAGLVAPKVYRLNTILEIGTIEKDGGKPFPIEKAAVLVEKIKGGIYDEAVRNKLNLKEKEYPKILVKNPKNTSLVEIRIDSSRKEVARDILRNMEELILKDHRDRIGIERYKLKNRIREIENKSLLLSSQKEGIKEEMALVRKNREQLKKQIKDVTGRLLDLRREKSKLDRRANPNNTLSLLLFNSEIQENRRYLNGLQDKLNVDLAKKAIDLTNNLNRKERDIKALALEKDQLRAQLEAFRETRVVKKATIPEDPVSPQIKLDILLAGVAGFFFFIFLAFFLEYLKSVKEREGNLAG